MDIKHTHDAVAVLTLGKDMVLRDYAQVNELFYLLNFVKNNFKHRKGAYRMRGISKGQKIHLLVIPEVRDLIRRELRLAGNDSSIYYYFLFF